MRKAAVLFFLLTLIACGGGGDSQENSTPIANAGPEQSVFTGSLVTLNGTSSSDVDFDSLTYIWAMMSKPSGSLAALSSTTISRPTFTADIPGAYVFHLVVNDGQVNSSADAVTVTATDEPKAKFEITAVAKTTTTYHSPSLMITVKNTGTATGYNASCDAHAKNAAGTIIDTAHAFFASLGNIDVGQSAEDEAVFFDLNSHADYVSLEYDCSWLTRK